MRKPVGIASSIVVLLLALGGPAVGNAGGKHKDKPEPATKEDKKEEKEDKPFDEVVKDMEVMKGLFTFYRKADENRILMEVLPSQLETMLLFAGTIDRGIGERGLYGAQQAGDFPFVLHRVGKQVQWILRNTSFTAERGAPTERAAARSFADAILGSAKIQSKPHPERKSVLVDASELFVRDLPGFAIYLSQVYQPTSYKFEKDTSSISGVKAFPENALLEIVLHYTTDSPKIPSIALADVRSIPVVVKYELSELKETGYHPRAADDRVGHFHTVQQDFTSDHPSSPYVRHITRWQLEKTDPKAALSPPKQPIVFWLENTIPVEYRDWMAEGALLWNKAFERIGFKDVIVVKQQPDDADWDPADTRYNTIRWFAGVDASFAIGPSRANPFTGQIYDADIGFSDGVVRNARRFAEEFAGPVLGGSAETFPWLPAAWARNPRFQCDYADGLAQQGALAFAVLEARGALTPEMERKLMRQYIVEVTAHEVGHTLGLRHNFRASTILKVDELFDERKTAELSQSSSVMDYNPIVLAGKGEVQGDFVPPTLGPYDYWAIEYAYRLIDGDETAELARIASRGTEPLLPYSTDEDALGTFSAASIDPLANQFDQSDDPIAYFRKRLEVVHELWDAMESKLAKPGEGYQVLRRALARGLNDYNRALLTTSKFVGGIYHHRDHVGDPNGRPPFTPVPAPRQREALEFLTVHAFSEKALRLAPGLLNKLAIERLPGLDWIGYHTVQRIDYPWHDAVLGLQRAVLSRLYNPITLGRLLDNELRFAADETPFRMAEMFATLDGAIWSELDKAASEVPSLRRNLQREQLKHLVRLAMRQAPPPPPAPASAFMLPAPPTPPAPEDATTLARASLAQLQAKIRKALAAGTVTDATTRAHLQETQRRIVAALEARMEKTTE